MGENKLKKYKIVLKKNIDKNNFLNEMNSISVSNWIPTRECSVEQLMNTRCFFSDITEEEAKTLSNDPRVQAIQEYVRIKRIPLGYPSSSDYNPCFKNIKLKMREEESNNNLKNQALNSYSSILGLPEGSNVDVVIVDGALNPNNPELKNKLGQSRVGYINWNDYCSLDGTYSKTSDATIQNEHGQHVSGIACGLYQGWAKGSNVYGVYPYDENYYEYMVALKNWHLSKTNGNPTISNHSYGTLVEGIKDLRNILSVDINGSQIIAPRSDGGAVATAIVSGGYITQINLNSFGSGYKNKPNISFYGGGYDEATAIIGNNSIREIHITNSGSNYSEANPPSVTFSSPPVGGIRATGYCIVSEGKIFRIVMTERGGGYVSNPTITFGPPGPGGIQATGIAVIDSGFIKKINIINGGNNHDDIYKIPDLIISGGGCTRDASWIIDEKIVSDLVGLTGIAKYSGGSWSGIGANIDFNDGDLITIIKNRGGALYAGGYFPKMSGIISNSIAEYRGGIWSSLGNGIKNTRWGDDSPGLVWELEFDSSGALYIGGNFNNANGISTNSIAKYYNGEWSSLGDGLRLEGSGVDPYVMAIAFDSTGAMYVGGKFNRAGGVPVNNIAKYHNGVWSALGAGVSESVASFSGPSISDIVIDNNNNIYVCGNFDTAGGMPAKNIAKYKNGVWTSLSNSTNDTIDSLAIDSSGVLYAGGFFTIIGGVSANGIARYTGTSWSPLGTGIRSPISGPGNSNVLKMEFDSQDNLFVVGSFSLAGGVQVKNAAKYKDGVWSSINSNNDVVHCLSFDNSGSLLISGYIYTSSSNGVMPNELYKIYEKIETIDNKQFKQTLLGGKYTSSPIVSFFYKNSYGPTAVASVSDDKVISIAYNGSGSLITTYTSPPNVVFSNGGGFTKTQLDNWGISVGGLIPIRDLFADSLMEDLIEAGVIVVAAAGNDSFRISKPDNPGYNDSFTCLYTNHVKSNPSILKEDQEQQSTHYFARGFSPGSADGVICVGSMRSNCCPERKSVFSNSGARVDVYAAGSNVISSINYYSDSSVEHPIDSSVFLDKWNGTSMAAPQVSGALACYAQNNRGINQSEAINWINANSRPALTDVPGAAGSYLYGGTNKILYYPGLTVVS